MSFRKFISLFSAGAIVASMITLPAAAADVNETIDNDDDDATYLSYTSAVNTKDISITDGGKFRIEYTGEDATSVLILSDQSGSGEHSWVAVSDVSDSGETADGYYVEYGYDKLMEAWGSEDFSDLQAVMASTWGKWDSESSTTLTRVSDITSIDWTDGHSETSEMPLSADKAIYNTEISFPNTEEKEYTYQWYKKTLPNGEGTAITGAEASSFIPTMTELNTFVYCIRTADDTEETSEAVPVFADGTEKTYTLLNENTTVNSGFGLLASPVLTSIHGGAFNPVTIKPYGQFKVTYEGNADINLILSYYHSEDDSKWVNVSASENGDGYSVFDYAACADAYGQDLSDVEYINITNTSQDTPVTINKIEWSGYPVSYGDLGQGISYINTSAVQGIVGYIYTEHVGGEFRAQDMKEDSYFYLEYKGNEENAVDLAMSSVSGALGGKTTYAVITPSESGKTGSNYYSKYTIADLRMQFGDNFARLDQINITTHSVYDNNGNVIEQKTAENAVLYYFDGTGAEVEKNKEDISWTNKPKTGIAFIGDSIVQNPLVTDIALAPDYPAKGDWNALLGRINVVNYGIGGETSVHISNRFYQLLAEGCDYEKIVMWFGVNDTGLVNNAQEHAQRVTENYKKALNQVKGTGKTVYVLSILPTTTAFYEGMQDRIETTNAAIKAMCESDEYKDFVTYVNLYDAVLSDTVLPDCTHNEKHANPDLFFDGLHPNCKGYRIIADILNPYIGGNYCTVYKDDDGKVSFKSGSQSDNDVYTAAYDADGRLLEVMKNAGNAQFSENGITKIKAFFWSGEMKPVSNASEITIN